MRTCDVCGWDTRSDTRVCAPCRRASPDASVPDDPARGEQLLTAVLQSTGARLRSAGSAVAAPDRTATPSSDSDTAAPGDTGNEQIVLREIESGSPPATTVNGAQSPTPDTSVTTSLLKALTEKTTAPGPTAPTDPGTSPDADSGPPHEEVDDVGDDVVDLTDGAGLADDDEDEPGSSESSAPSDDPDDSATPDPTAEPDDDPPTPDDTAEPADDTAEPADDPPTPDEPATGRDRETLLDQLRMKLQEMGAWTAVAQLSLLVVGLMSVFQVVVLVVVLRFLRQADTLDTVDTVEVLAAHDRAMNSMLPMLVVGASAAIALAIWCVRRATDRTPPTARLLGIPVSLWAMIAAVGMVVAVVAADTSSMVEQASRMALLAIAACALLGAAAFLAPRGIAVAPTDTDAADVSPA
ncbi:hypothetical protein BH23ACT10_BH23ACT10_26860 [soil metagenome]